MKSERAVDTYILPTDIMGDGSATQQEYGPTVFLVEAGGIALLGRAWHSSENFA